MSFPENEKSKDVPILETVSVIIAAGTSRTISFTQEFFGKAVSLIITNLDGANTATYQVGGTSRPTLTLAANAFRTFDDAKIDQLDITAGAAGAVQVQAQVQLFKEVRK